MMTTLPIGTSLQRVPPISEDLGELAVYHLRPEEVRLISSRASLKRRAEFIAGRIAARDAVKSLLGPCRGSSPFWILRKGEGPTGCPMVVMGDGGRAPHVSISHADGIAVAAASFGRVGIDIAMLQPQERSFADETFGPLELARWANWLGSEEMSALTLTTAFVAKEAALKWLGTGFGTPLRAVEVLPKGCRRDEQPSPFAVPTSIFAVELRNSEGDSDCALLGRVACIEESIAMVLVDEHSAPLS